MPSLQLTSSAQTSLGRPSATGAVAVMATGLTAGSVVPPGVKGEEVGEVPLQDLVGDDHVVELVGEGPAFARSISRAISVMSSDFMR